MEPRQVIFIGIIQGLIVSLPLNILIFVDYYVKKSKY